MTARGRATAQAAQAPSAEEGWAYALSTSACAGGSLTFRLPDAADGEAVVRDTVSGRVRATFPARGPLWKLELPHDWPSSLYATEFSSGGEPVYFALRPARPSAAMLLPVPFLTWQAYNEAGTPGQGLYPTEGPRRATRVSFDRPGGGPAGFWEAPFYEWLARRGYAADYCSNLDLHDGTVSLDDYRLLVVPGHDEYWTREMRDAAEEFTWRGGNLAFFGGNTCWWQTRLEDGGRTMVCHRDPLDDPLAATDPARVTVEWSSAPVNRPENSLTGLSFRRGAGCWEDMTAMASEAYTVSFADHWVFEGTGLRDGDTFARGAIGYETDAADFALVDGVPLVTGADGTPGDFVVLALADLRHWRSLGQGGFATMGVMRRGAGTVFNAATISWPSALAAPPSNSATTPAANPETASAIGPKAASAIDPGAVSTTDPEAASAIDAEAATAIDPVVERITRNVLDRLSRTGAGWEPMGDGAGVSGLAASEHHLFALRHGGLAVRACRTQNLPWRELGPAPGLVALAACREAVPGCPVLLYGLHADGTIHTREPVDGPAGWSALYPAPEGACAITPINDLMYAATPDGALWSRALDAGRDDPWHPAGHGPPLRALAGLSGRLAAITADGRVVSRRPGEPEWTELTRAPGLVALTATAGRLVAATAEGAVVWREARRDTCADTSS